MSAKAQATKTQEVKSATTIAAAQKPVYNQTVEDIPVPFYLMQKTLGNQAMQQWTRTRIQGKIEIGPANDIYEQEADRAADEVMRMTDTSVAGRRSSVDEVMKSEVRSQEPGVRKENDIIRMKAG